ncbi:MAG TPA: hypothetical protein VGU46_11200 [Acidobacteriaceae bacterium]|nr:hypothetical protein [Acidobacteriaceae bacterium]
MTITVLVDAQSHQILHLKVQFANPPQDVKKYPRSLSVDYAPINVGGKTFWLPTAVEGHFLMEKRPWKWNVRFSDYHQYTSSVKLLPDDPTP